MACLMENVSFVWSDMSRLRPGAQQALGGVDRRTGRLSGEFVVAWHDEPLVQPASFGGDGDGIDGSDRGQTRNDDRRSIVPA